MTLNVKPLDYQEIRSNGTITLRVKPLQALGAKRGDWVAILEGPPHGTLLIRLQKMVEVGPAEESP